MSSASELLKEASSILGSLPSGRREAEMILLDVLSLDRVSLYRDDPELSSRSRERVLKRVQRRAAGEPLQYILGHVDFLGLKIKVGPGVLIPRPETEWWLEELWGRLKNRDTVPFRFLDVCAGSGCITLAMARRFPSAQGFGIDISLDALRYAEENRMTAGLLNVGFICGDLISPIRTTASLFEVIMANPPYVSARDYGMLDPVVHDWEPAEALFAGEEGTSFYDRIIPSVTGILNPGGVLALEIGTGQGPHVSSTMRSHRFENVEILKDYAGHDRAVFAWKKD